MFLAIAKDEEELLGLIVIHEDVSLREELSSLLGNSTVYPEEEELFGVFWCFL